jgi:hypothetical protein
VEAWESYFREKSRRRSRRSLADTARAAIVTLLLVDAALIMFLVVRAR